MQLSIVVVGKPFDLETVGWLEDNQIDFILHEENFGFPASINDLYDAAFTRGSFNNLIIMGSDVVPYPSAIDSMISLSEENFWEWICASEFDVRSLVARYPEARPFFRGETLEFSDFTARPWELHESARLTELTAGAAIELNCIKDVRNLCLFTRATFNRLGYADVNFWPGGYFEDNDYCRRGTLAGIKACGLPGATFFHFWSRTIHQGTGKAANDRHFRLNAEYYAEKWGGMVGGEAWLQPFNMQPQPVLGSQGIFTRDQEAEIIRKWRERGHW